MSVDARYKSPWNLKLRLEKILWEIVYYALFRFTPKYGFNYWRCLLLKIFGAKLGKNVFIYPSAKIYLPKRLVIGDRSCLGPNVEIYNLGLVKIGAKTTLSKESLLLNGSHDFSSSDQTLIHGLIEIGDEVFIGSRAIVMMDVKVEDFALIGAGAIISRDVLKSEIVVSASPRVVRLRSLKN